jgi:carbonic anhydrase/acetyltransferase-like protein (isoleucine patch superfamily)
MSIRNWIWKRDSRLTRFIFFTLKRASRLDVPVIPVLHHLLLAERRFRRGPLRAFWNKIYSAPLLRMQCSQAGRGLVLYENMPKILGNLDIRLGSNVTLSGEQSWMAGGPGTRAVLSIGDNSYLGHGVQVVSGSEVRIGRHVLVANRVTLNGYDGHPLDPLARARGEPPGEGGNLPIVLNDYCWIGNDATVLKGVSIGRGAVVASGAMVTQDVPDLALVGGIPARVIRILPAPERWGSIEPHVPATDAGN